MVDNNTTDVDAAAQSPVHDRHVAARAKFAEFGGWLMPLEYKGAGILVEHRVVRSGVGLFDVSHLGKVTVSGPGAVGFLNTVLTNDLSRIGPGQAQYTLICTDAGGIVDDLIAYLHSANEVLLMPNAANSASVINILRHAAPDGITVIDQHRDYAVFAVQGTHSDEVLQALDLPVGHDYMSFRSHTLEQIPIIVCRSGYTGERGYELIVPVADAGDVWEAVVAAGEPYGLQLCGLGARDTLRTEMGYPLHGQDLTPQIDPVATRLSWAVGWDKPAFGGREALMAIREQKPPRLLRGLRALDRGIPRPGMTVLDTAGAHIGQVTSGTFSPTAKQGIGLAMLDRRIVLGDTVIVRVRNRDEEFEVVKTPFIQPSVRET